MRRSIRLFFRMRASRSRSTCDDSAASVTQLSGSIPSTSGPAACGCLRSGHRLQDRGDLARWPNVRPAGGRNVRLWAARLPLGPLNQHRVPPRLQRCAAALPTVQTHDRPAETDTAARRIRAIHGRWPPACSASSAAASSLRQWSTTSPCGAESTGCSAADRGKRSRRAGGIAAGFTRPLVVGSGHWPSLRR